MGCEHRWVVFCEPDIMHEPDIMLEHDIILGLDIFHELFVLLKLFIWLIFSRFAMARYAICLLQTA